MTITGVALLLRYLLCPLHTALASSRCPCTINMICFLALCIQVSGAVTLACLSQPFLLLAHTLPPPHPAHFGLLFFAFDSSTRLLCRHFCTSARKLERRMWMYAWPANWLAPTLMMISARATDASSSFKEPSSAGTHLQQGTGSTGVSGNGRTWSRGAQASQVRGPRVSAVGV